MVGAEKGMSDPDRPQCPGKEQEKYVRWSKVLSLSFPGAQIRLEVQPGPAAIHINICHPELQAGKPPWARPMDVRSSCPRKEGGVRYSQVCECGSSWVGWEKWVPSYIWAVAGGESLRGESSVVSGYGVD